MSLTRVAVYRRTVAASLARVRENVLDWEHLPWLHRETFAHVRLLERRRDGFHVETARRDAGFRAETARRDAVLSEAFEIDVAFEPDGLVYHSRTVAGRGAGTDIVTRLEPRGKGATAIVVEFLVPDAAARHVERLRAAYLRLYTHLWDQDEAMMIRRQALLDAALRHEQREVNVDGVLVRHSTVCPHRGGPLGDTVVEDGCITCPWHGYRFDLLSGRSADGRALRLEREVLGDAASPARGRAR